MKKLFTSFVLALVSYSILLGQCGLPAPYINEDFDATTSLPACWTSHASNGGGAVTVLNNLSYAVSGTNSLRMGHAGFGNATLFAVTPKLAAINGILTFQARTDGSNPLIVGTMPTAIDTASFTAFDTIFHINAYQQFTVDFSSYIGTDSFIVFKYEMDGAVWTVLDDVNYSIGTAISTIVEHQTLNIYPNPASTSITLDTKEIIESVSIYNLNGQLVKFVGQAENVIDIQDFPKGLYIVQAQTAKGIFQNKITKK